MYKFSRFLFLIPLLCSLSLGQNLVPKKTGIYFRVDDNHPVSQWQAYEAVFNKYGLKTSLAVNITDISFDPASIAFLREAGSQGHEIMDHTPDHATQYFLRVTDTASYSGRAGVDHINRKRVCLSYAPVDTAAAIGSGFANIAGDIVVSTEPGGFAGFSEVRQIYFPSLGVLCDIKADSLRNADPTNPDTLRIMSAWDEPISLDSLNGVRYMRIGSNGGKLTDQALRLLAERALALFDQSNLTRPVSWIQPGGLLPNLNRQDLNRILGREYQYRSGAVYVDRSLKVLDEYDPESDRRFGMMWGDFDEESQTADHIKGLIADQVARHFVLCGLSHFSSELGGWDGYLARVDSLLSWCVQSGIPVKTEAQWAEFLYGSTPDPFENVIPPLNVDHDANGIPDGYSASVGGVLDRTDGFPDARSFAYSMAANGRICRIGNLAGVEKGDNDFSLYLKGTPGSRVDVSFRFSCPPFNPYQNLVLSYSVRDTAWRKYSLSDADASPRSVNIPANVSLIDIDVTVSTAPGGWVKVSGMELGKSVPPPPPPAVPLALQPSDGSTAQPLTLTLQWQEATNADGYNLQIASDSLFATVLIDDAWLTATWRQIDSLANNARYFWRVRSRNAAGESPWSTTSTFWTVRLHHPPCVKTRLPDKTVPDTGGVTFVSKLSTIFVDQDSLPLTYTAISHNPAVVVSVLGDSLCVRPSINAGNARIVVTAIDPLGASVSDSAMVNVQHVNHAPSSITAIVGKTVTRNSGWMLLSPDLKAHFSDADGDTLMFAAWTGNAHVTVRVHGDSLLAEGAFNYYGSAAIIASATDPYNVSACDTLQFTIENTNLPPFTFGLLSPRDGDTLQAGSFSRPFRWHRSVDPDDDTTTYVLRITGGDRDTTISGIADTVCVVDKKYLWRENTVYTWRVTAKDQFDAAVDSKEFTFRIMKTAAVRMADLGIPTSYGMDQNYPNPFNPSTTIRYALPQRSQVMLVVFNALGQSVAQLVDGTVDAGYHEVKFDGSGLSSGVYFYRLHVSLPQTLLASPAPSVPGSGDAAPMQSATTGSAAALAGQDFVQTRKLILLR